MTSSTDVTPLPFSLLILVTATYAGFSCKALIFRSSISWQKLAAQVDSILPQAVHVLFIMKSTACSFDWNMLKHLEPFHLASSRKFRGLLNLEEAPYIHSARLIQSADNSTTSWPQLEYFICHLPSPVTSHALDLNMTADLIKHVAFPAKTEHAVCTAIPVHPLCLEVASRLPFGSHEFSLLNIPTIGRHFSSCSLLNSIPCIEHDLIPASECMLCHAASGYGYCRWLALGTPLGYHFHLPNALPHTLTGNESRLALENISTNSEPTMNHTIESPEVTTVIYAATSQHKPTKPRLIIPREPQDTWISLESPLSSFIDPRQTVYSPVCIDEEDEDEYDFADQLEEDDGPIISDSFRRLTSLEPRITAGRSASVRPSTSSSRTLRIVKHRVSTLRLNPFARPASIAIPDPGSEVRLKRPSSSLSLRLKNELMGPPNLGNVGTKLKTIVVNVAKQVKKVLNKEL